MVASGMRKAGYTYINIDDMWAEPKRDPTTGKLQVPKRSPISTISISTISTIIGVFIIVSNRRCWPPRSGTTHPQATSCRTFASFRAA